jgi:chromatin remodeling complex protein RSC6
VFLQELCHPESLEFLGWDDSAEFFITDEELAEIVGGDEMPRHEVVKRMWAYIKENKLQDPKNKQVIICDEKLSRVIPTKKFKGFGMTKFLKEHMNVDQQDKI